MELEHVHISGFKAIDEIEFEPGQITLVTGPNNAGKTSLLEAIRLAGDPRSITEFEDQAPKLIKADHDAAECRVRVRDDSDEIPEQRVEIRRPPTEQAVDEVIRLLSDEEFGFARYVGVPLGTEVSSESPRGQAPRLPVSTTRLAGTDEDRPPSVSTAVAVSTGVTSACPRPNS